MDERPLCGTVTLVAGATRGCGRATAVEVGRAGAHVYATGRSRCRGSRSRRRRRTSPARSRRDPADRALDGVAGTVLTARDLSERYGTTDVDGSRPDAWA